MRSLAIVPLSAVVNDLGVQLDSQLTMADHVVVLSRSCFFYLRQLRSIKQALTPDATRALIHAFIRSQLDYCNSVLADVSNQLLQKLQVVQNTAACLVTGAKRCERMTPVLRELHWLPVRQRIMFKTAVLAYKCQHGAAPQYLQSYCESTSTCTGCRHLRSSQMRQLVVRRMRTKYGDCSFTVQGPRVWNSLPVELRAADISQTVFRNKLKTYLFDIT